MAKRPGHELYFSLPKDWKDKAGEMFKQGATDIEVFVALNIKASDHAVLLKQPEYYETFMNGMAIAEAFWITWARENMYSGKELKVNVRLFETFMERIFKWKRKEESKDKKADNPKTKGEVKSFEDKYLRKVK